VYSAVSSSSNYHFPYINLFFPAFIIHIDFLSISVHLTHSLLPKAWLMSPLLPLVRPGLLPYPALLLYVPQLFRTWLTHRRDDGGSKLLWNISQYLPDYMVQHPRRQPSSYLSLWQPEISPRRQPFVDLSGLSCLSSFLVFVLINPESGESCYHGNMANSFVSVVQHIG
jgi:hypothetical protein